MPSTVLELISNLGLDTYGRVNWGEQVSDNLPGIYIVSLSDSPDKMGKILENAPLSDASINDWLNRVPMLRVDGNRPTKEILMSRLSKYWFSEESILYIGKASRSVRQRVRQFYKTDLGYPRPHAGGHWLKTLSILDQVNVYWTLTRFSEEIETKLLHMFMLNVSSCCQENLYDFNLLLPFANLEVKIEGRLCRKQHGISKQINRNF